MGDEGNSSGSDSEPSADNLDADEIEKIVPQKPKKKEEPKKKAPPPPPPKKEVKPIKKPQSPPAQVKRPPAMKEMSKSPMKRPMFNAFDRLSLRKKKPEMKDAWTQTTPKSKEQLEKERREHRQRKNAHYLMLQQQQQQLLMQKFQQQQQQQQVQLQNQRGSYPAGDSNGQIIDNRLHSNPSNFKAKQNLISAPQSQFKGQSKSIHGQQQPQGMLLQSQPHPPNHLMEKQRKQQLHENGHSPQPQIRIRTEHHPAVQPQITIKQKNDLMKYEERLISDKIYPQSQIQNYQNMGPQNGSATQQLQHRGSNKRLPQIQSSSSQRQQKNPHQKNSVVENKTPQQVKEQAMRPSRDANEYDIARAKTLNQTQYNSLKNQNNVQMQMADPLNAHNQIHQRHTSGHQNQMLSSQPQIHQQPQNVARSAYNGQNRKLVSQSKDHSNKYNGSETPENNRKRQLHASANGRQQIPQSMSPNKLNKVPVTAQSQAGVNLHHQILAQMNNIPGGSQHHSSLFNHTTLSKMQAKKNDQNHNSIAALQYSGMVTSAEQSGHNSQAIITHHPQNIHLQSGVHSQMSQQKVISNSGQKVQWTNSTIQQMQHAPQQNLLSSKQGMYPQQISHGRQQQMHGYHQFGSGVVQAHNNYRNERPNVFSGSTLTNPGSKMLVAQDGSHSAKQQSLNKSLGHQQLSPFAYK